MTTIETRTFRLAYAHDSERVIRGKIDVRATSSADRHGLPHVILLHGFKGFMDWGFFPDMARRIAMRGLAAVRFNASGSGIGEDLETLSELGAFERNTLSREIEDLERVRDWIRDGGADLLDPTRASLIGHSRGGGLALIHAAERADCRCVVTWAPVASFDRFDDREKLAWRRRGYLPVLNSRTGQELRLGLSALEDLERNRARFDVPAACRRLASPTLLIHGSADESVPAVESQILCDALGPARARRILIEDAGHTFGVRHPMTASTEAWERVAQATLETVVTHS